VASFWAYIRVAARAPRWRDNGRVSHVRCRKLDVRVQIGRTEHALGILLLRTFVPESPRWLITHGWKQQADAVMSDIEQRVRSDTGPNLAPTRDYLEVHPRKSFGPGLVLGAVGSASMRSGGRSKASQNRFRRHERPTAHSSRGVMGDGCLLMLQFLIRERA